MVPLQNVFCASTTQPKVTPTNHYLLINIHRLMFSLGHQGLPRLPQSLEKPPSSIPQEGVRGHGEGGGGGGGGGEVQGAPQSEERSLSNCCLMSCPPWTSWNGGSITRLSSPFAKLVKGVFPVAAASSKSEWVFSVAGNVVTPKRANWNPEKVEDLVVVKCNLRLLKSMGFIR